MKISKRSQYALRAMVHLASISNRNKPCSVKEISQKENISFDYLEKIIAQLEKKGLVKAKRGVRGGYFLSRSPDKISAGEIIKILEGTVAPVECVAHEKKYRYQCPRKKNCKTINVWNRVYQNLASTLNSITLADLVNK